RATGRRRAHRGGPPGGGARPFQRAAPPAARRRGRADRPRPGAGGERPRRRVGRVSGARRRALAAGDAAALCARPRVPRPRRPPARRPRARRAAHDRSRAGRACRPALTTKLTAPYSPCMNAPGEDRALADAIRRHEERVARDPESLAFAQLADLYRKAGRTGDAVACCRDGLRRGPHYTTARLILAKTLLAEGQLEPALAELSAILQTSPKDVQCHRLAAEVHRRAGRLDVAVGHLEKAVGLDPGDRESKALLSLLRADASAPGESAG